MYIFSSFSFSFFGLFGDYIIYICVRDICIYTGCMCLIGVICVLQKIFMCVCVSYTVDDVCLCYIFSLFGVYGVVGGF